MQNIENTMNKTVSLLNIPSPTGNTNDAVQWVKSRFEALGLSTRLTEKGALIATLEGKDQLKSKTLSAHVDTLGAMVKEIKGSGRLKLSQLGGYAWTSVEGETCVITTLDGKTYTGTILFDKTSVHVYKEARGTTERTDANMEVRLDENVFKKEETEKLGIRPGDFVSFDTRTEYLPSGYLKSRHLDDKACVGCMLAIAENLVNQGEQPPHTIHFFISPYEEVGHGSSAALPTGTVEMLALDMAAMGDGQTSTEHTTTICAKDSSGPYDLSMRKLLIQLAEEKKITYQVDIYPFYGSDASAALRAGWDIRCGLIGPGVDASHAYERTHREGMQATIDLGTAYCFAPLTK
jgi:putative aminopeptidase FrvX